LPLRQRQEVQSGPLKGEPGSWTRRPRNPISDQALTIVHAFKMSRSTLGHVPITRPDVLDLWVAPLKVIKQ
jgi:hypothetical protein